MNMSLLFDGLPDGWSRRALGDIAVIKKGKNITKDTVEGGEVPVVAGGLKPAYFHNTANAIGPEITVSASGANAGYVNLYHHDIWASDCSYLSITENLELWFLCVSLKERQVEITGMQQGAAQPQWYPKHLARLKLNFPSVSIRRHFHESVEANFHQIANLQTQKRLRLPRPATFSCRA